MGKFEWETTSSDNISKLNMTRKQNDIIEALEEIVVVEWRSSYEIKCGIILQSQNSIS